MAVLVHSASCSGVSNMDEKTRILVERHKTLSRQIAEDEVAQMLRPDPTKLPDPVEAKRQQDQLDAVLAANRIELSKVAATDEFKAYIENQNVVGSDSTTDQQVATHVEAISRASSFEDAKPALVALANIIRSVAGGG